MHPCIPYRWTSCQYSGRKTNQTTVNKDELPSGNFDIRVQRLHRSIRRCAKSLWFQVVSFSCIHCDVTVRHTMKTKEIQYFNLLQVGFFPRKTTYFDSHAEFRWSSEDDGKDFSKCPFTQGSCAAKLSGENRDSCSMIVQLSWIFIYGHTREKNQSRSTSMNVICLHWCSRFIPLCYIGKIHWRNVFHRYEEEIYQNQSQRRRKFLPSFRLFFFFGVSPSFGTKTGSGAKIDWLISPPAGVTSSRSRSSRRLMAIGLTLKAKWENILSC